jgi:micrococcal nuclease
MGDRSPREHLEDGTTERVRFIGVDTPERGQNFAAQATAYATRWLAGRTVYLERDVEQRDRYGRLLAYVWLSRPQSGDAAEAREKMFNARLLWNGLGVLLTIPPNVAYVDMFTVFQREGRDAELGLWKPKAVPVPKATPKTVRGNCDPSYPDVCIPPPPPDLDCGDVPYSRFRVEGDDPHGFDRDRDGVGCES